MHYIHFQRLELKYLYVILSSQHLDWLTSLKSKNTSFPTFVFINNRIFPQLLIQFDHHAQILNHINHPLAKSTACL